MEALEEEAEKSRPVLGARTSDRVRGDLARLGGGFNIARERALSGEVSTSRASAH